MHGGVPPHSDGGAPSPLWRRRTLTPAALPPPAAAAAAALHTPAAVHEGATPSFSGVAGGAVLPTPVAAHGGATPSFSGVAGGAVLPTPATSHGGATLSTPAAAHGGASPSSDDDVARVVRPLLQRRPEALRLLTSPTAPAAQPSSSGAVPDPLEPRHRTGTDVRL